MVFRVLRRYISTTSCKLSDELPSRAQVVLCGGGVVGSSVAFHLPKFGFKDVVQLEQGSVGCGTTWHSAGLLGAIRGSRAHTKLTMYSNELYSDLNKAGHGTGIKQTGTLNLATSRERLTALRRQQAVGRSLGVESSIVLPDECSRLCPILNTEDVVGGLYVPDESSGCDPGDICRALSQEARLEGVKLFEGVSVQQIEVKNGKVDAVMTNKGKIECEIFINCAGMWARQLGRLSSPQVNIPLATTEHFYVVTKPFEGVDLNMPTVRDSDNQIYIRQWSGGILSGCFELNGKSCFSDRVPESFQFQLLPEDWDHCEPLMESLMHRIPSLSNAEIRQMINGPESFTPDMHAIMGEAPEISNYYVGAGMNSSGIATAGGFGRALAEWIARGEPPFDLWEFDISRFCSFQSNFSYLQCRAKETLARHYIIPWPNYEMKSGRCIKMSPFYSRLDAAGASWGCVSGWERPNWFCRAENEPRENSRTFGKPNYFESIKKEHLACRNEVALFDLSPFVKLEIEGEGITNVLQNICGNNVDVPVSQIVYTGMLNAQGGYQTDCTMTRLEEHKFLAVCPSSQQNHITSWLHKNMPSTIKLSDVTSLYSVIGLMGPKARSVLQLLTTSSLDNSNFPYATSQVIDIGFATDIRALRVSYVGELGWELHVPTKYALHVFDRLTEAGEKFGLVYAGAYAMDTLRLEKGYRHWGHELDTETSPIEARLMHAVDLHKNDFIGKKELLRQKEEGVNQLLGTFAVKIPYDENVLPWGKELIYRNGVRSGYVTSAGYGFSINNPICMGYIESKNGENINAKFLRSGKYEIEIDGKKWPATLSTKPLYDPDSISMKL